MPLTDQALMNSYTGNGVTTAFAYGFKIWANTDLKVTVDGVTKVLTTDYTVSGVGADGGGNVTFVTAPASLAVVTIACEVPYSRATDYQENGDLKADTLDSDMDKSVRLIQQLRRDVKRALKFPIEYLADQIVTPVASRYLKFKADGSGVEGVEVLDTTPNPMTTKGDLLTRETGGNSRLPVGANGEVLVSASGEATGLKWKFMGWVNITDYGAVGDGTTDDTAAIQAAVDTGKDVFIPRTANSYKVTAVITLATAGQTIWGLGERSYIKGTGANQNVFTASGVDGIKVYGCKIEAPSTKSGMSNGCGIYFINCDRVNILENLFVGGRSAGVQLKDCNYGSVCGNVFISSVVVPATDDHTQAGYDIYLTYSSSHNKVIGNTCISGIGVGIGIQTITSGDKADFNTIVGNIVRDQPQYGIMLYRMNVADTAFNNVVADNTIANISGDVQHSTAGYVYGAGIYVQGAEYTTVEGNSIYNTNTNNNIVFTLAPGAIGVTNCRNVNITGNTIRDPEWYGIVCQDTGQLGIAGGVAVISGNMIENSTAKTGILLQDFPKATLTGNRVNSCAIHGIHIKDGTAAIADSYTLTGNVCESNVQAGIYVENANRVAMHANLCNLNGTHGIYVNEGIPVIEGNSCAGNTARGIGAAAGVTEGTCANNLMDGNNPNYSGLGNLRGVDSNILINPGGSGNEDGTFTRVRTFTSLDATPSVKNGKIFKTANAGATTITMFDDGVEGQEITVIFNDTNTTIDFTASALKGNVGVDFTGAVGDVMTCTYYNGGWYCQVHDNTP